VFNLLFVLVPAAFGIGFLLLAPRFTSWIASSIRVIGFVVGIVVLLFGRAWSSYVDIYGVGGENCEITAVGDTGSVYLVDEEKQQETLVFEGTVDEEYRYVDGQQSSGKDKTLPYGTAVAGGSWHWLR